MSEDKKDRYIDYLAGRVTNLDLDQPCHGACSGGFLEGSAADVRESRSWMRMLANVRANVLTNA